MTKWLPSAILDVRNSLWITFLAISDQYRFWIFFTKWLPVAILDFRKSFSISFLSISHWYATLIFLKFLTMADVDHFGFPKFTFDSGHFRSIQIFFRRPFWMSENHFGSHFWPIFDPGIQIDRPFWMSEIHFRWHFWPFQIHTEFYLFFKFFDKMAAGGHFGCPQITFDRISRHFRSIRNFFFFLNFFDKMDAGGHFGWGDNVSYRTHPRYLDE